MNTLYKYTMELTERKQIVWLDVLRVLACFMVIGIHAASTSFFNFSNANEHLWGNLYGSLARAGVPLFIIISGILLLPLKLDAHTFLKRRLGRILLPFLFWAILYVVIASITDHISVKQFVLNLLDTFFVTPNNGLHLWYMYVLIGLYLFMPILSPWLVNVSMKEELAFLILWVITLLFPFIHSIFHYFWGEASWNSFGALHYFSGYIGYLVLGHFMYKYIIVEHKLTIPIALFIFLMSYLATLGGQQYIYWHSGGFNYNVWSFTSVNAAMMAVALIMIVKNLKIENRFLQSAFAELSDKSFGIFLVHYFIVYQCQTLWEQTGISPGIIIPLNTFFTFILAYVVVKGISYLPGSKYIIG